ADAWSAAAPKPDLRGDSRGDRSLRDPLVDVLEDRGALPTRQARRSLHLLLRLLPLRHRVHPRAGPAIDCLRPGDGPAHGPVAVAADDPRRPVADADGEETSGACRGNGRHRQRFVTPFERALRDRIKAEGPITVEAYMEACNTYYYASRDPF